MAKLPLDVLACEVFKYLSLKEVCTFLQINHGYAEYNNFEMWKLLMAQRYSEYYQILLEIGCVTLAHVVRITKMLHLKLKRLEDTIAEVNIYHEYNREAYRINELENKPEYKLFLLLSESGELELIKCMMAKYEHELLFMNSRSLNIACEYGHLSIVKLICTQTTLKDTLFITDKNRHKELSEQSSFNYAIYFATVNGHLNIVQFLVAIHSFEFLCPSKHQLDNNFKPMISRASGDLLMFATISGSIRLCQWLIDCKIEYDTHHFECAYEAAAKHGHLHLVTYFEPWLGPTLTKYDAFCKACANGHADIVAYFLEDQNLLLQIRTVFSKQLNYTRRKIKEYPIIEACAQGHVAVVKLLLTSRVYGDWNKISSYFFNGMISALSNKHTSVVKYGFEYRTWSDLEIKRLLKGVNYVNFNIDTAVELLSIKQIQLYLSQYNKHGFKFIQRVTKYSGRPDIKRILNSEHIKIICTPIAGANYWQYVLGYRDYSIHTYVDLFVDGRIPYPKTYVSSFLHHLSKCYHADVNYEPLIHQILDLKPVITKDTCINLFLGHIASVVSRLETEFKVNFNEYAVDFMRHAYIQRDIKLFHLLTARGMRPVSFSCIFFTQYRGNSSEADLLFIKTVLANDMYVPESISLIHVPVDKGDVGLCELLLNSGKLILGKCKKRYVRRYAEQLELLERPDLAKVIRAYLI